MLRIIGGSIFPRHARHAFCDIREPDGHAGKDSKRNTNCSEVKFVSVHAVLHHPDVVEFERQDDNQERTDGTGVAARNVAPVGPLGKAKPIFLISIWALGSTICGASIFSVLE